MLTLYHGDDLSLSRKNYIDLKSATKEAISFEADSLNLTELTQSLSGVDLFASQKNIFIEQLLTKKKSLSEREAFIELINSAPQEINIYLWENKEIDKKTLGKLKAVNNRLHKFPQTLFLLIDSLKPNNHAVLLDLYYQTLKTTEAELVFFMIVRQIRLLLALSSDALIEETKRMQSWQKNKMQKQLSFFTQNELVKLHSKLFEIEQKLKVGALSYPLSTAIDILLFEI